MSGHDRCVFYISNNMRYSIEAGRSAGSLNSVSPDIDTVMFHVDHNVVGGFGYHFDLENIHKEHFYLRHCHWMIRALFLLKGYGYSEVAFSDCDTYFCSDVSEAFDMLSEFDIMGVHAPARKTCPNVMDVSHSFFPEINIGFIPMRTTENVLSLWEEVILQYEQYNDVYGNNDQGPFRDVLWKSIIEKKINFLPLSPEWNCRFNFPVFVAGEVKVLHGRNNDLSAVSRLINSEKGMRSWKSGEIASLI